MRWSLKVLFFQRGQNKIELEQPENLVAAAGIDKNHQKNSTIPLTKIFCNLNYKQQINDKYKLFNPSFLLRT